jgi:hypothetical protein
MKIITVTITILIISLTGCNEIKSEQAAPIIDEIEKIEEMFSETPMIESTTIQEVQPTEEKITRIVGCPIVDIIEVKESPNEDSPVVDWLIEGTCVTLDQRTDDNKWVRIFGLDPAISKSGWILVSELILSGELDDLWAIHVR